MQKKAFINFFEIWSYLSIVGIASTIIFGSELIFTLSGGLGLERQEWIQYLLLGTLFPVFAVILVLVKKKKFLPKIVTVIDSFFVFFACAFLFSIFTGNLLKSSITEFIVAVFASLFQVVIIVFIIQRQIRVFNKKNIFYGLLLVIILVAVWMAGIRLITHRYGFADNPYTIEWWFWPGWPGNFTGIIQWSFVRRGVLIIGVTVVTIWHFYFNLKTNLRFFTQINKKNILLIFDICVIVLFFLLCIKTDRMLNEDIQGHIDFLLGPVVAVRQGAWLLWDQPSGYGFLWVLIVAFLPVKHTVIALTIFLGLLNFSLSVLLYKIFCEYRQQSILNRLFAFLLVITSFLIRSFPNQDLEIGILNGNFTDAYSTWYWLSPIDIPQVSALRTVWCCVLLIITSQYFFSNEEHFKRISIWGCFFWSVGCLWSAESFIFSTATWIPAYSYILFARKKYKWMFLPLLMISIPVIFFSVYYYMKLGHIPEWGNLFEFVYTSGPDSELSPVISRIGAMWIVLFLLISVVSIAANLILYNVESSAIGLSFACFGAIWSVTSYYVGYSANSKLHVLIHVYILVIVIILRMIEIKKNKFIKSYGVYLISKSSLVVFIVFTLVCGLDVDRVGLSRFFDSQIKRSYDYFDARSHRAPSPQLLVDLLTQAQVNPTDHIMLANSYGNLPGWYYANSEYITDYQVWLPMTPSLSNDRRSTYLERFINRSCVGGWLISPNIADVKAYYLLRQVDKNLVGELGYFRQIKKYSNSDWILDYYEPNLERLSQCKGN